LRCLMSLSLSRFLQLMKNNSANRTINVFFILFRFVKVCHQRFSHSRSCRPSRNYIESKKNFPHLSRLCRSGNKAWRLWSVGGWPIAIFRKEILQFLKAIDKAIPFQLAYSCLSIKRAEYSQPFTDKFVASFVVATVIGYRQSGYKIKLRQFFFNCLGIFCASR